MVFAPGVSLYQRTRATLLGPAFEFPPSRHQKPYLVWVENFRRPPSFKEWPLFIRSHGCIASSPVPREKAPFVHHPYRRACGPSCDFVKLFVFEFLGLTAVPGRHSSNPPPNPLYLLNPLRVLPYAEAMSLENHFFLSKEKVSLPATTSALSDSETYTSPIPPSTSTPILLTPEDSSFAPQKIFFFFCQESSHSFPLPLRMTSIFGSVFYPHQAVCVTTQESGVS